MNDSILKTLTVSFIVCLFCSLVVSFAAVSLRDAQNLNKLNDQRIKILKTAAIYDPAESIESQFTRLTPKFVDFSNGLLLDEFEGLDLVTYDPVYFSKQAGFSTPIPPKLDIAVVKNKENVGKIYLLKDEDSQLEKIILPIRGYGLWGTLYGYIAIDKDLNTIRGLEFYEHKETPGLGAEVDNPKWKALWDGKKIYKDGEIEIAVIKGKVDQSNKMADYQVDGLSGATLTSRGVTNMLAFWFSESGYRETLNKINYDS
jgi:Na+-transporting NADH:ubiquinone oxidoreductase subunit C